MRVAAILLGAFFATSALAQSQQAEDDEKPGSRGTWKTERAAPSDQLPQETSGGDSWKTEVKAPAETLPGTAPAPAQPARSQPAASTDSTPTDIVGNAPVRLRSRRGAAPDEVHNEGTYAGVSLDGDGMPPKAPRLPIAKGQQRLTWPGFQVKDGVPTVFLQTTATPRYTVSETPGALLVTLHGTSIKLRNNERPLEVQDFGTDVSEITAKPHGKDVIVIIKRTGAGHRERVEAGKGGYQLLLVELSQAAR